MISVDSTYLVKIKSAFAEAESAIKLAERVTAALPESAINQLRYAGQHLSCLIVGGYTTPEEEKSVADKAYNHCCRARFDAYEDIVLTSLQYLREFVTSGYPADAIEHFYVGFVEALKHVGEYQRLFVAAKKVQCWGEVDLEQYSNAAKSVSEMVSMIRVAVVELEKIKVAQKNYEDNLRQHQEDQRFVLSIFVTIYGTVAGVLGTVFTIYSSMVGNHPIVWTILMILAITFGACVAFAALKNLYCLKTAQKGVV